jgi:hypothetical protein
MDGSSPVAKRPRALEIQPKMPWLSELEALAAPRDRQSMDRMIRQMNAVLRIFIISL